MKVLISSIGTRGDVQPLLALAIELRELGHAARLCVAPNFKAWVEASGVECIPIGPDLKQLTGGSGPKLPQASAEQRRELASHAVRSQFPVLTRAAQGCDLVVAAGALQLATRSVTQALRLPYVFAAYCPAVLPSADHPPPKMGVHHPQSLPAGANAALWEEEESSWNQLFRATLNDERSALGLDPIDSVQQYIFSDHPWLAADAMLAPAGASAAHITQTGAWMLADPAPLSSPVQQFLERGEPPIYLGFGSMRAAQDTGQILLEAARALGRRAILSQGWANLRAGDDAADCLVVDDLPHAQLFPRVAAAVHHGGAGTTTSAARAGIPQVLVPHHYDQFYWAHRVQQLGIGVAGPERDELSVTAIAAALEECLRADVCVRARALADRIESQGARAAAARLVAQFAP